MKKIGIITLYGNQNYGNRLQNLAVQEILEERGFRAESIVIINRRFKWRWRTFALRKFFQGMILGDIQASRIFHFLAFDRKYIRTKYLLKTDGQIPFHSLSGYDYYVAGSDQVWNIDTKLVKGNSALFFLRFAEDARKVCISPSIGIDAIPEEYAERMRQWLSGFRYLSCREKQGAQEISRITGRDCEWLIDPTLDITGERWKKIFSKSFSSKASDRTPYVFLAFLDGISKDLSKHIEEYAAAGGYTIMNPFDPCSSFYGIDPAKFVELLSNAHIVFTDSFHVTAFSINFHVPFYVFDRNTVQNISSRIESICETFCLKERYIRQQKPFEIQETCSVDAADRQLILERRKFSDYLDRCFEK